MDTAGLDTAGLDTAGLDTGGLDTDGLGIYSWPKKGTDAVEKLGMFPAPTILPLKAQVHPVLTPPGISCSTYVCIPWRHPLGFRTVSGVLTGSQLRAVFSMHCWHLHLAHWRVGG